MKKRNNVLEKGGPKREAALTSFLHSLFYVGRPCARPWVIGLVGRSNAMLSIMRACSLLTCVGVMNMLFTGQTQSR
jgi:hypothetical protein